MPEKISPERLEQIRLEAKTEVLRTAVVALAALLAPEDRELLLHNLVVSARVADEFNLGEPGVTQSEELLHQTHMESRELIDAITRLARLRDGS